MISETVAALPWHAFRTLPNGNRERMPRSPAERLLNNRPSPELTPFSLRETLVAHALTWGNGYAEIVRDNAGRAAELWPIEPDRVEVSRARESRELYYEVSNSGGANTVIPAGNMFHLHGLGSNGTHGYSVVSLAARSIGLSLAAEEFGSSFFANGAHMGAVLKHPNVLGDQALSNLKEAFEEHRGPHNAHRPLILEEGMDWQATGVPPEDAQFLETRELQVAEIARWLRIPPHKLMDLRHATFTNIEHQSREFVTDAIIPWTVRLEQEADRKLVAEPTVYTKLNVNALMRGDSQARADFYSKMFQMGVFSINEIRALEDMDPIWPEGDKRLVQLNLTTLEKVGEDPDPVEPSPGTRLTEDDGEEEEESRALNLANRWLRTL